MNTHWAFNRHIIETNRKLLGLTPKALGERIGATGQTIRNWESGLRTPKGDDLSALANVFRISPLSFYRLLPNRPRLVHSSKRKLDAPPPPRTRHKAVHRTQ